MRPSLSSVLDLTRAMERKHIPSAAGYLAATLRLAQSILERPMMEASTRRRIAAPSRYTISRYTIERILAENKLLRNINTKAFKYQQDMATYVAKTEEDNKMLNDRIQRLHYLVEKKDRDLELLELKWRGAVTACHRVEEVNRLHGQIAEKNMDILPPRNRIDIEKVLGERDVPFPPEMKDFDRVFGITITAVDQDGLGREQMVLREQHEAAWREIATQLGVELWIDPSLVDDDRPLALPMTVQRSLSNEALF